MKKSALALLVALVAAVTLTAQSTKRAGADVVVNPVETWFSRVCFLDSVNNTTDVCLSRDSAGVLRVENGAGQNGANGATATLKGSVSVAANTLTSAHLFVGNGSNVATDRAAGGDVTLSNTGSFTVGAINGAALGTTTATSGNILIGSGSSWGTHAVSGDLTLANTGAATVAAINGATLGTVTATSGNHLVADGSAWQSVAMSGDATQSSTGAVTIGNAKITSAKIDPTVLQTQTTAVTITAVNLRAINTTPIVLVAAPSAGIARIFDGALIEYVCSACAGGSTGGAMSIVYHGLSVNQMASTLPASVITGTTAGQWQFIPVQTSSGTVVTSATGFDFTGTTDFTGSGTGTLKIWVRYHDVTL